jgi:hypothetical protein
MISWRSRAAGKSFTTLEFRQLIQIIKPAVRDKAGGGARGPLQSHRLGGGITNGLETQSYRPQLPGLLIDVIFGGLLLG